MDRVCPLLGLVGDRRSVIDGVDAAHRCHAESPPLQLGRQEQAQLCLTASHARCERYLGVVASNVGAPRRLPLGDGLVSTRMVLTPAPAWRGIAGRARRAPRGPLVLGAGAALALGMGGVAVAFGMIDIGRTQATPSEGAASASPRSSPIAFISATPVPTTGPTVAPAEPTPDATVAATPVSTPATTAVPTTAPAPAQTTYTVQQGDTLAVIAQQFGTSVAAVQEANGIEDPDEITIGQVLVIP